MRMRKMISSPTSRPPLATILTHHAANTWFCRRTKPPQLQAWSLLQHFGRLTGMLYAVICSRVTYRVPLSLTLKIGIPTAGTKLTVRSGSYREAGQCLPCITSQWWRLRSQLCTEGATGSQSQWMHSSLTLKRTTWRRTLGKNKIITFQIRLKAEQMHVHVTTKISHVTIKISHGTTLESATWRVLTYIAPVGDENTEWQVKPGHATRVTRIAQSFG